MLPLGYRAINAAARSCASGRLRRRRCVADSRPAASCETIAEAAPTKN
jgi:hypothetical protein